MVDLVKTHDKEFTYNSSSKVVNEDGTPKGGYHGTYAMAALTTDSEGRQVVAVITVEQRSNMVTGIESYDVTHAINGRKTGSQVDSRSQGVNPIKAAGGSEAGASATTVSVADFLDIVKDTHRSILSDDVLNRLNLERPADGYYTDRVRHSVDNAATETDSNQSLQSDQAKTDSADAAVEAEQENAKADKAPVDNSPAPSGKYDESHPNKIAQWMAKETSVAIKALGVDNAEISIDYNMDKASNGYYLVKDGKRQIVLNGQLGGTTREGQVYSAQQNIRYVLGHELGHLVQGVGYTGDTNVYTRDILAVYQQNTGTTAKQVEAGVRDIMVRYMDEADRADSKLNISREDVTLDYAKGEYAANCLAEMLGDYNTLRKIARSQNRNIVQKAFDRVAKFRSEIVAERRKRSIQEHEAAAKRRGDNAAVNVNGNVNDWFMIANLYDEAAENLEETLREAMKNAGKMKIAEESSAPRASITDNERSNAANQDASASEGEPGSSVRKETQAEITKKYGESVDEILAKPYNSRNSVLMGYTPSILQKLGVPDLPVVIGPGHVYSIAKTEAEARAEHRYDSNTHYHGMGADAVKGLYEKLESPIAVIASKDTNTKQLPVRSMRSVVAIIDIGKNGRRLLEPVQITVERHLNGAVMDVNVLSSAYEGNAAGLLQEAIAQENSGDIGVFYMKNEAADMVADRGIIPTAAYQATASGTILHQIPEKVNLRVQNQTQTLQFTNWFGDWQNHPTNASKVVNEDGTPKVMYHGTSTGGFHMFDTYSSNFGLFGTGSYFTDNADVAQSYTQKGKGQNPQVYAVYLNIRNPIDMDANASIARWQKAAPDAADYFKGRKTNEDCFRALKEYCQDEMMYNYDAYDYIQGVIEDMGYDGITHIGGGRYNKSDGTRHRVYITFHPEQVKSATDNVGTFDKNNPDIRYSLSDGTDETDLPGWDEDNSSKFDQFTDTYEKGTNLIGKSKSIQAAAELKREYGSRANTQSIATKYRQMSTLAEQFSNVHLDGMMGEDLLGKENALRRTGGEAGAFLRPKP